MFSLLKTATINLNLQWCSNVCKLKIIQQSLQSAATEHFLLQQENTFCRNRLRSAVIYKASKHILEPRAFISMHFSLILCPWELLKHVLNKSFQNQPTNTDIFNPVTVNSRITCFISFSWKLGKHAWNTCLNNSRIRRIWCLYEK